jgi:hypothetical protein
MKFKVYHTGKPETRQQFEYINEVTATVAINRMEMQQNIRMFSGGAACIQAEGDRFRNSI